MEKLRETDFRRIPICSSSFRMWDRRTERDEPLEIVPQRLTAHSVRAIY
jgi:hypothetical protein